MAVSLTLFRTHDWSRFCVHDLRFLQSVGGCNGVTWEFVLRDEPLQEGRRLRRDVVTLCFVMGLSCQVVGPAVVWGFCMP